MDWNTQENLEKLEREASVLLSGLKKQQVEKKKLLARLGLEKLNREEGDEVVRHLIRSGILLKQKDALYSTFGLGYSAAVLVKLGGSFGFATPCYGEKEEDIFIPGRGLMGAMPGDRLVVRPIVRRGASPEGEAVAIASYGNQPLIGTYTEEGAFVLDSAPKIAFAVAKKDRNGAHAGDKVLAELIARGQRHWEHRIRIVKTFGSADSAKCCCEAALAAGNIIPRFPAQVLQEARDQQEKGVRERDIATRIDLRGQPVFTIDSADSLDLDDAVMISKKETGWELSVHIADVSHYVRRDTALDKEAFERGTSVYYANKVVPMLPKELSNGICSLNPQEDRLAFSVFIQLDEKGEMTDYRFAKTVIRSVVKGVYKEINAILDGTAEQSILNKYGTLLEQIQQMKELSDLLNQKRLRKGTIELQSSEAKIILDEFDRAVDIQPRVQGVSEQMIEEFMLLANEAAASLAESRHLPFVYRVHEQPSPEKLETLSSLFKLLGLPAQDIKPGVKPAQLSKIFNEAKETPYFRVVNTQTLRSMAKARYDSENLGHYGLCSSAYAHFTSPIRRYPDLAIHRILGDFVRQKPYDKIVKRYAGSVDSIAKHSTSREIAAMTCERDCDDIYKAEYMSGKVGGVFEGVISSVVPHGMYVELDNSVEGLIRIDSFSDGGFEMTEGYMYRNVNTGVCYKIGDRVKVKLVAAVIASGRIDFILDEGQ